MFPSAHRLSGEYDLDCSPMGLFTFQPKSLETLIKAKPVLLRLPMLLAEGEENLTRKKKVELKHWISPSSSQSAMFFHR